MKYNKLVRDKIPVLLKKKGIKTSTHIADDEEYWQKLKDKLKEEVDEFLEKSTEEELADILEVINTIVEFKRINKKKIEHLRTKKAEERGGFKRRIILEETNNHLG